MPDLVAAVVAQFLTFTLVAFRLMGLTMFAPLWGATAIPANVRVLAGLGLAWVVFPAVPPAAGPLPTDLVGYAVAVAGELAIGVVMGFLLSLVWVGLEIGAQVVGQQTGLSLSQVYNPAFEEESAVLGTLYYWLLLVVFLTLGGHLAVARSLMDSFRRVPLLHVSVGASILDLVLGVMEQVFVMAVKVSAPALVALTLVSVAMGFIARTVPQLNILVVGFPLRLVLGFVVLSASLAVAPDLFKGFIGQVLGAIEGLIGLFGGTLAGRGGG